MFDTHVARPKTRLTTLYGAITGVACLGSMPVEQTLGPRVDSLADKISQSCMAATLRRDTKGVAEANQCRAALLRAIGFGAIACTDELFGEHGLNSERAGRGGEPKQGSSPAAGDNVGEGGAKNGATSISSANGAARASHGARRRADRLRKRLDRSLYSPQTAKAAGAGATAGAAAGAGGAAAGTGADKGKAGSGGRAGGGAEDDDDGGSIAADDLDEVVFPWYVVGLRRDGAPQSWWLTNKLSTFV
ncbi:unnamed protein product [Ectocarpus fasciculatus]